MIHHGDLFDVLPTLDADSIDACVTDPPYELGFMGKKWDATGIAFQPETWAAVLRVLKPGAYLLAFGGTRTFHRIAVAIEDAGFEIRDTLSWLYGSGFPKSMNVGRAIDDAAGAEREIIGPNPCARQNHDGQRIWIGDAAGKEQSHPPLTAPATDAAKQWEGWGTALKPAWEPIILARKPLRGTVAANVLKHGTGALNVEACRVAAADVDDYGRTAARSDGTTNKGQSQGAGPRGIQRVADYTSDLGRWPANVLLDEEAAALLDEQTGELTSGDLRPYRERHLNASSYRMERDKTYNKDGDVGGASRFYYVAKPSREERDFGTERLRARQRDESRKDGNPGGDNPRNRGLQPRGNFHPTVKPVELMRWLVKLVTPPDGVVLDPFMGSGTTGMACRYEHRRFIGIEREAEYIQIAEARIAAVAPLFGEASA